MRVLGRWMRVLTVPNQSSVAKAYQEFDEAGRMKLSAYYDRIVDVMEELTKFTLLTTRRGTVPGESVQRAQGKRRSVVAASTAKRNLTPRCRIRDEPVDGTSAEGHSDLRLERNQSTCGLLQARPSSKPFVASAIAPGPFRGWGRNPLACIHTQREPVLSPAGTGTEYRRPQAVSWYLAVLRAKASGDRSHIGRSTSIRGTAANAIRGEMTFSPCRP